ncbi:MAG: hypothetical protein JSW61_10550 [Candidatus Thorarchaeota archaeon]|nr:MAG: hypothetical protein JSW61_10550 [Candidatus Thorarchaeota archaeon]
MSDPVMEAYTKAYNDSGQQIQAFGVINTGGQVLWQSNNWDLTADAAALVGAVAGNAPSVVQNQVKYSVIGRGPERLVARSVAGHGVLVMAKVDDDKWAVAWATAEAAPDAVHVDVDRAARTIKGKI